MTALSEARQVQGTSAAKAVIRAIREEADLCVEALVSAEEKEVYRLQGAIHRLRALADNLDAPETAKGRDGGYL